jgi:hypothetical protein
VAAGAVTAAAAAGAVLFGGEEPRSLGRGQISSAVADLRDSHRSAVRRAQRAPMLLGVPRSKLESIAECESHGDPRAASLDGTYRGKYQFDRGTWRANGGSGDPARAPELEQDLRAAALYRVAGSGPWPNCG